MKKLFILAAAALIAAAGCQKIAEEITPAASESEVSGMIFNVTVGGETKAVKTAWESGDEIVCFFENQNTLGNQLRIKYNGSAWTAAFDNEDFAKEFKAGDTGTLYAIHFTPDFGDMTFTSTGAGLAASNIADGYPVMLDDTSKYSITKEGSDLVFTANLEMAYCTNVQMTVTGLTDAISIMSFTSDAFDSCKDITFKANAFDSGDKEIVYGRKTDEGYVYNFYYKGKGDLAILTPEKILVKVVPEGAITGDCLAFKTDISSFVSAYDLVQDKQGHFYQTKTMKDGKTWMIENLRYVPEGVTVSDDPKTATGGVVYPYTTTNAAGSQTPATDAASVKKYGLLYNGATIFGAEITAENCASFEGCQSFCPDGWHIPTFAEMLAFCGKASKLSKAAIGTWEINSVPTDTNAAYYNADYDAGNIKEINEAGFNFVSSGMATAAAGYTKATLGTDPMTYYWGSTVYDPTAKTIQFMSFMASYVTASPDGKLTVAFNNNPNFCAVRCVKN